MFHSLAEAVGQARLADLHREAQSEALAEAARQARRARRRQPGAPGRSRTGAAGALRRRLRLVMPR
jgi:hypothetical protein